MFSKVDDKIMYRLENNKYANENFYEGNEFIVDENYKSFAYYFFDTDPNLYCDMKNKRYKIFNTINDALNGFLGETEILDLSDSIKKYLNDESITVREYVLEHIRQIKYPNLISRKNCLFLSDKNDLIYWKNELYHNRSLYQVSVTGNLFCSYEYLLPRLDDSINKQEIDAKKYWEGKLPKGAIESGFNKEYLFQGKVKVLRKMPMI